MPAAQHALPSADATFFFQRTAKTCP